MSYSNYSLNNRVSYLEYEIGQLTPIPAGGYVPVNGNSTINNVKTFTTCPKTAVVPVANNDIVNKLYVDNAVGAVPTLQQVVNSNNGISNFVGGSTATIQSTNFTNGRQLQLNADATPTIKMIDNANASHFTTFDIDTINLNGTSTNWSSIVAGGTTPNIDQVLGQGSLATDKTQVFNVSTGSSTNSISATSVGLYAPNGYANDFNGNYTAGGFGLQENTRGTLVSLSAQEPSLQMVTTPAVAGYSATANYTAGGINTNYTFGINTGQLNIGSSVYINSGLLDLANNNITSVNNIQLNTINGLSPTTIGLTWGDFAGSNAYNNLPSNVYQLINGGQVSTQYVNSFQVNDSGVYVTTLDSQVLSIKDNNNFYAHYKINGLDTSDTAYEIQCSGGTQPLNIIASTINLNGSPLTPVVRGKFNYSGVGISSGTQQIFYSSPATLSTGTVAVTWTFTFDGNFVNNASPTFFSVKAYAYLYSTTYGVIGNSGLYPSAIMSYDSNYQTTISYTDYYTISGSDTYYPYVYQENPIGASGNVYLTGVFIQV